MKTFALAPITILVSSALALAALGVMGAAVAVHAAASAVARAKSKEVNKDMGVNE